MKKILIVLVSLFIILLVVVSVKAEDATPSSDTIREKVQEKVTKALNSPRAYIGTITDISSETIQIRKFSLSESVKNGEIQQIATTADTAFVSIAKTSKTIKFSDVAIGDFIVAMGYKNGNSVLDARRILVTAALKPSTRKITMAKVTKITKNTLEVTLTADEKLTVEQEDSISILTQSDVKQTKIKFSDIEIGDSVIMVGKLSDNNTFLARKIVVIVSISTTAAPSPKASPTPSAKPTSTPKATP